MRGRFLSARLGSALSLLPLGLSAYAQKTTPTPALPVFATEANIVHVDAVVTDKKGRQVADLTAADFEIESKGKRFQVAVATYVPLVDDESGPQQIAANGVKLRPEDVRRVMAFLVARPIVEWEEAEKIDPEAAQIPMGLSNRSEHLAGSLGIDQMFERFIETDLKPRDLVAFVNADSRKPLLSQFTADRGVLAMTAAAFRKDLLNPGTPPVVLADPNPKFVEEPLVRYCLYVIRLARDVLDRLKNLPGRKMLFVLSGVLRFTGPDYGVVGHEAKGLIEEANRAGVTIYGINPGGLNVRRSEALGQLAGETGGSTIERTQFPGGDLEKIMELNRGYYLLGYDPGEAPSVLPRRVKVHLKRQELSVAARPQVYEETGPPAEAVSEGVKPPLETHLNSPLAVGVIQLRISPTVRWNGPKSGEFQAVVDIDPTGLDLGPDPAAPTVDLEVVARVADERGAVLKANRVRVTARVEEEGPDPLHFVVRAPIPSSGFFQADVVVRDNRNGQKGSATAVASLPSLSTNKSTLLASSLILTSMDPGVSGPRQKFRPDSVVVLSCVVAHARRSGSGREAQIEIRSRITRDGQVVLDPGPEVLRKELPELISINGRVSLPSLAAGDYVAEVTITDLLGEKGRNVAHLAAPFSVLGKRFDYMTYPKPRPRSVRGTGLAPEGFAVVDFERCLPYSTSMLVPFE